jgi:hypothetical protein
MRIFTRRMDSWHKQSSLKENLLRRIFLFFHSVAVVVLPLSRVTLIHSFPCYEYHAYLNLSSIIPRFRRFRYSYTLILIRICFAVAIQPGRYSLESALGSVLETLSSMQAIFRVS